MAFWGIEIKPGKPHTHQYDKIRGRLHISQATLGWGVAIKKSVVQCNLGNKSPVLLCSLFPEKNESCPLHLEFEEEEDVTFSIVGPRSVHLTGYYLGSPRRQIVHDDDDTESFGEDIGETDTERSSYNNSEEGYEDDFIDDGEPEILTPSPGKEVVVEEILEEKKIPNRKGYQRHHKKKYQVSDSDDNDAPTHQQVEADLGRPANQNTQRRLQKKYRVIDSDGDNSPKKGQLMEAEDDIALFACQNKSTGALNISPPGNCKKRSEDVVEKAPKNGYHQVTSLKGEGSSVVEQNHQCIRLDQIGYVVKEEVKRLEDAGCQKRKRGALKQSSDSERESERKHEKGVEQVKKKEMLVEAGNGSSKHKQQDHQDREDDRRDEILTNGGVRMLNQPANREVSEPVIGDEGSRKRKKKRKEKVVAVEAVADHSGRINISFEAQESHVKMKHNVHNGSDINDKKKSSKSKKNNEQQAEVDMSGLGSLANHLVIEKLSSGKTDGKIACDGSKVAVLYSGKLENGEIFDSNIGKKPFKFRLGKGRVIEGWDIGVSGMQVGEKRRLKIPPSMASEVGGNVPKDTWLEYDIELVDVR